MSPNAKLAIFVVLTSLCGCGVVTFETPQNLLLFAVWFSVAVIGIRRLRHRHGNRHAVVAAILHGSAMAAIITAAILAPVKRIDAVLKQTVQLQATEMTVAQLSKYCQLNRKSLPLTIYIPSGGPSAKCQIRFTTNSMSLQQFIDEVERQSGLTHHFAGCGNAYSILYGNAYSFGLSFIPQRGSGYEW